ncbi:uncharacterized protein TRUGW13939_01665 [Talaromyces rugulosus]|uniref:Uncharacterized protein n=1 Tax=Talaromyces rugulosus TaxID=121627 RepID=A0A7H8QL07_TALRU|nr:uncharacterized protein TRUGW13939_01665 [Talaromyces rugulosus]QKX54578.1 hypothetical protein TRUGW13939_01665 [Talaromyces rugulosus]
MVQNRTEQNTVLDHGEQTLSGFGWHSSDASVPRIVSLGLVLARSETRETSLPARMDNHDKAGKKERERERGDEITISSIPQVEPFSSSSLRRCAQNPRRLQHPQFSAPIGCCRGAPSTSAGPWVADPSFLSGVYNSPHNQSDPRQL